MTSWQLILLKVTVTCHIMVSPHFRWKKSVKPRSRTGRLLSYHPTEKRSRFDYFLTICWDCGPNCVPIWWSEHCWVLSCETESQSTGIYIGLQSGVSLKMKVGIRKRGWRRAWRYPAYLWSLRWVYAVKKPEVASIRRIHAYTPIHHWAYIRRHLGLMHVHVHCGGEQKQKLDCG